MIVKAIAGRSKGDNLLMWFDGLCVSPYEIGRAALEQIGGGVLLVSYWRIGRYSSSRLIYKGRFDESFSSDTLGKSRSGVINGPYVLHKVVHFSCLFALKLITLPLTSKGRRSWLQNASLNIGE